MKTSDLHSPVLGRWQPSRNTAVALATEVGMIIAYAILGNNSNNMGIAALVGLLIVPILAVGIPVYWTTMVEHQGLDALGITSRHWLQSCIVGVGLSLLVIAPLWFAPRIAVTPERWLPMAAAGAASLFEPLFIFGWLQLRFEKDFGVLPSILLAALCFALYHIGYLPQAMSGQFFNAAVFAVAFRLTTSLLVAWPLLWAVTSASMCISSNMCFFNWGMVSGSVFVFGVEVVLIAIMGILQQRRELRTLRLAH
jgi:membrane protease YdiL (CAAX protease family)